MIIKSKSALSIIALLLLSGCGSGDVFRYSITAKAPADLMQSRQTPDMLGKMDAEINNGALGIERDWLYEYAGEAEEYGQRLDACQAFIIENEKLGDTHENQN